MLTSIALTLVLSCAKPATSDEVYVRPPIVVSNRCEGRDRVERDVNGNQIRRFVNACTRAEPPLKFGLSMR
jgi:hypothetical protein